MKGQFFSTDFMIAILIIFFIAAILSLILFEFSPEYSTSVEERSEMETKSSNAIDTLVKSSGVPANWTS